MSPQIVVYAAHCGDAVKVIGFGEHPLTSPPRKVVPDSCHVYPGHQPENGSDFAYCKLPTPITDVPITPILMGCELDALKNNKEIVLVGYGEDENTTAGVKRETTTVHDYSVANKAFVGGNGHDTCFGDSGGPAYVQLNDGDVPGVADGAWRVYGITSYGLGDSCGGGSFDSIISNAVPWIEADSGIDITPCHDANGVWTPGPNCGGFPMDPQDAVGAWATGCSRPDVSGYSATCGPAYDANSPLQVTFSQPKSGEKLVLTDTLTTKLSVQSNDAESGAITVTLMLDGVDQSRGDTSGSTFSFTSKNLNVGAHTLLATATDSHGNKRVEQLNVSVAEPSGGCQQAPNAGPWMLLAVVLMAVRPRRRIAAVVLATVCLSLQLVACGHHIDVTADTLGHVTTATNPAPNSDFGPTPAVTYDVSGTVDNSNFTPLSVIYTYQESQATPLDPVVTSLYLVATDQNNYCPLYQQETDTQGAKYMQFLLFNSDPNADAPTDGTYAVVDPNMTPATAGNYANALYFANDPNCNNLVPDANAWAKSGNIVIKTIFSSQGAYLDAQFTNVAFGTQQDQVSGHWVAQGCAAIPDFTPTYACVAPPTP